MVYRTEQLPDMLEVLLWSPQTLGLPVPSQESLCLTLSWWKKAGSRAVIT